MSNFERIVARRMDVRACAWWRHAEANEFKREDHLHRGPMHYPVSEFTDATQTLPRPPGMTRQTHRRLVRAAKRIVARAPR